MTEVVRGYPAEFTVQVLDRVDRTLGIDRVLSFPSATPVDRKRELSAAPILAVTPAPGEPWIGLFDELEEYVVPPAASTQVVVWPGGRHVGVVRGEACFVLASAPRRARDRGNRRAHALRVG